MNRLTIQRAARSLAFRRRLSTGIVSLETSLLDEMQARGTSSLTVPGFCITVENFQIAISPRDDVIPGQLELPIDATDEQIENWLAQQDPDLE